MIIFWKSVMMNTMNYQMLKKDNWVIIFLKGYDYSVWSESKEESTDKDK